MINKHGQMRFSYYFNVLLKLVSSVTKEGDWRKVPKVLRDRVADAIHPLGSNY